MSDRSTSGRPAQADYGGSEYADQGRRAPLPPLHGDRLPPLGTLSSSSSLSSSRKLNINLPPPPPFRMHSYHHPILSSSYDGASTLSDRERQQQQQQQQHQQLSPPLSQSQQRWNPAATAEGSRGEGNVSSELPRFLVQRSGALSTGTFQLPPLSATFGSPSGWRSASNGGDGLRRSPVSPDGSRGVHLDAFRENAAMMMGSRSNDRMLPPYSPPLGVSAASPLDSTLIPSSSSLGRDGTAAAAATRKMAKAHVPSACLNCKRAHLACDVRRPCRRCINLGKSDTCIDVQHKKRGRPRLNRQDSQTSISRPSNVGDGSIGSDRASTSPSSTSLMRHSPASEPSYYNQSPTRAPGILSPPMLAAPNSLSAHRVVGPTHGAHPQTRTPSASVSGSSYPFSRPDNARTFPDGQAAAGGGSASSLQQTASAVVTIICSTNLQCARVSEDCHTLLGYQPSEVVERSLFELVHPAESTRLQELWTSLIDPVGVVPQAVPASADIVMSTPSARLMAPAAGTIFVQENMRLRQRNGMFDFYSIRLHLGGGFGVDLYRRETLNRAYIVASLLKLGNDATHPDTALLCNPYQGGSSGGGKVGSAFWTPTSQMSMASPQPHASPSASGGFFDAQHQRNGSGLPAYASRPDFRLDGGAPSFPQHQQQHQQRLATESGLHGAAARTDVASTAHDALRRARASGRPASGDDGQALAPREARAPISPPSLAQTSELTSLSRGSNDRERKSDIRRKEAVPSYGRLAGREQSERLVARPTGPVAGASSPSGKRRSSISLSATSPHSSVRTGVLTSLSRTSSSRDGILC